MRRTALALTTAALTITLAACNGTSVKSQPDKTPPATAPQATAAATTPPAPTTPSAAHLGDTITLHGMDDGSKIAVTIVKWAENARGADEFTTPGKGKRFVAAQIRFVNTGTATYDDSPSNGMQVADSEGQRFDSTIADVTAGPSMASSVTLKPGDKALGWIVFEVPKTSKIVTVQVTLDSGFSDEVGEWAVK